VGKKRTPPADQQRQDRKLAAIAVNLVQSFADRYPDAGLNFAVVPLQQFAASAVVERKRKPKVRQADVNVVEAMRG
jgi:hypothetical protein